MSILVSLRTLKNKFGDVTESYPWGCLRFTISEVKLAVQANNCLTTDCYSNLSKQNNIRRIAYFVINGWTDPISIDVGVPALGNFDAHIDDGYHRWYAAVVRKDKNILATISGDLGYAARMFRCRVQDLYN